MVQYGGSIPPIFIMEKEIEINGKKRNIDRWVFYTILYFIILIISHFELQIYEFSWILETILPLPIIMILEILSYLKKKGIIKEKVKYEFNDIKTSETETLFVEKERCKQHLKCLEEELEKRKDKNISYKIERELKTLLTMSIPIIVFSLFYFGAMPTYFGVNNEFINPTNASLGINKTFEIGIEMTTEFIKIGSENAKAFFWIWWAAVFLFMILPILRIIKFIIEHILKKYNIKRKHNKKA
jgi:hypothetical protein